MSEKIYAPDMDFGEWTEYMERELGEPAYRAGQVCQWLWQKHADAPEEMTNLSKPLREKLAEKLDFAFPQLAREQRSVDGTRKFLWKLRDGESVESVLMKQGDRLTACISTQVGCPLQCTFCATGLSGFVRNLTAGEIAGQVAAIEKQIGRDVNNVVYMGMGEPFLNTEAVLKSVRMLNDPKMRGLGIRHITISTSGVIPGIAALAESGLSVRLAVSLHAANGELRSQLMPVNNSYPVEDLREALAAYQETTGDRVTIEYALLGGVNDSVERARELVRYLRGIHAYVNLIPFNAVDGRYAKPEPEDMLRFKSVLQTAGFECEIRAEQGADIDAACGQLRRKEGIANAPLERGTFASPVNFAAEERAAARAAKPQKTKTREFTRETGPRGDKRRKENEKPQERYRSGKMKEARPTYKGDGQAHESVERGGKNFRAKPPKPATRTKNAQAAKESPFAKFYKTSAKPKKSAKAQRGKGK